MVRKVIALFIVIAVLAVPLYAQRMNNEPLSINEPAKSSFSLLDPGRFHMSQSYSFMYSSSKYGSQSLALYLNSIEYQIADPLKIQLDIGYLHTPGALVGNKDSYLGNGKIIPGVSVSWKPSRNFLFQFNYQELPGYYYDRYYYDPWYYKTEGGIK